LDRPKTQCNSTGKSISIETLPIESICHFSALMLMRPKSPASFYRSYRSDYTQVGSTSGLKQKSDDILISVHSNQTLEWGFTSIAHWIGRWTAKISTIRPIRSTLMTILHQRQIMFLTKRTYRRQNYENSYYSVLFLPVQSNLINFQ
jgi:hypothetical protein